MHVSDSFRSDFLALLDDIEPNGTVPDLSQSTALVQRMLRCTDTLPDEYCDQVGVPSGSSYAVAARQIADRWRDQ